MIKALLHVWNGQYMKKKQVTYLFAALLTLSVAILIPSIVARARAQGNQEPPRTIKIGVISSSSGMWETTVTLFEMIIEPDIGEYCKKLPRRAGPPLRFEFLVECAEGSNEIHQQKVEQFHAMGVDLIIGGGWSSMAYYSLDYVNANDMLLVSWSSTSPALAIPRDNLFRLCPDDNIQGRVLAKMMSSQVISNVVVIQRDDEWGNELYDVFQSQYEGTILGRFVYPLNEDGQPAVEDFHSILKGADDAAAGAEDVAVLLISFDEAGQIIIEASGGNPSTGPYLNIYGDKSPRETPWFGTESAGRSQSTLSEAPEQAIHLKMLSALSAPPYTPKYNDLYRRYLDRTGQELSFYTTAQADAAWLLMQAVLETQCSTSGTDIAKVLPYIAWRYYGYSGWCLMNDAGDGEASDFDIWGYYRQEDGTADFKTYGYYDGATGELTWFD